ncbi:Serine/threonine-protein kinase MRCK alpha [Bienertia sinuspersici]
MEDIGSFWTYPESVDDLKQKLQYTTYELEITRKETNEEIKKSNDQIKKLLQLLQTTCKERDEAKSQLKKLQQIMSFNNKPSNLIDQFNSTPISSTAFPAAPFSPDSPLLTTHFPTKTNSSLTESSSFSLETQNNNNNNNNFNNHTQSHVSSPIASSPDSNNIVFSTTNTSTTTPIGMSTTTLKPTTKVVDQESLIIANLAKGRPLPQKGKLLQAVLESGPLLSTLMVAGSLPQWRNPPGLMTHQIPPVNLKGCEVVINQSPGCNKFYTSQPSNVLNFSDIGGMSNTNITNNNNNNNNNNSSMYNGHVNGSFGVCPSSLLDFGSGSSGSCFMGGRMMMNSGVSFDCQIPKRQRIL